VSEQLLDEQGSVVLNASGNGTVSIQADSFRVWTVTSINVRTSQGVTQTPVPQCTVYLGDKSPGQIVAQTWMGNRATAGGTPLILYPSTLLIVEWTNGVPASTATVSLNGTMALR
jgi:hypothetical protein